MTESANTTIGIVSANSTISDDKLNKIEEGLETADKAITVFDRFINVVSAHWQKTLFAIVVMGFLMVLVFFCIWCWQWIKHYEFSANNHIIPNINYTEKADIKHQNSSTTFLMPTNTINKINVVTDKSVKNKIIVMKKNAKTKKIVQNSTK